MPRGWAKSSGDNRQHVGVGKRIRDYRLSDEEISALPPNPRTPPPPTLEGGTRAADWLRLAWRSASGTMDCEVTDLAAARANKTACRWVPIEIGLCGRLEDEDSAVANHGDGHEATGGPVQALERPAWPVARDSMLSQVTGILLCCSGHARR